MSPSAIDPQAIADTQTAAFVDRLSVNGVETRRSKAPRIGGGVAAHASSDMFKSLVWTTSSRKMDRQRLVIDSGRVMASLKQSDGIVCSVHLKNNIAVHEWLTGSRSIERGVQIKKGAS